MDVPDLACTELTSVWWRLNSAAADSQKFLGSSWNNDGKHPLKTMLYLSKVSGRTSNCLLTWLKKLTLIPKGEHHLPDLQAILPWAQVNRNKRSRGDQTGGGENSGAHLPKSLVYPYCCLSRKLLWGAHGTRATTGQERAQGLRGNCTNHVQKLLPALVSTPCSVLF